MLTRTRLEQVQKNLTRFIDALADPDVDVDSKRFYDSQRELKKAARRAYDLIHLTGSLTI